MPVSELFTLRDVGFLTKSTQFGLLILMYLASIGFYFFIWTKTGDFNGVPVHWLVIFAPLYEELIFRGFLLTGLYNLYGKAAAIILSSFLFGIWHLKNFYFLESGLMWQQIIYAGFILGPLLAYLALRFRSLWPGVMIHALNNIFLSPVSWLILNQLMK